MSYKAVTLRSIIDDANKTLFLPHIQRPFVWEMEQVYKFLDSLMKNYPIQTFLFWKTRDKIKARKFMDDIQEDPNLSDFYDDIATKNGTDKRFVLDGQQRLQSLISAFYGTFFGKNLMINLWDEKEEVEDGRTYTFKLCDGKIEDLPFFQVNKLFEDRRNSWEIARDINNNLSQKYSEMPIDEKENKEERVQRNINQLVSILREERFFWVEELDGVASEYFNYKTVLNVFIRVNNGGTKLEAGDLMFAAMKSCWDEIEENIEEVKDTLNSNDTLSFGKEFILKGLKIASGQGATLTPEYFSGEDAENHLGLLKNNWERATEAFKALGDFIYKDLKLYSYKVFRSYNAFIPIFDYFFKTPKPSSSAIADLKSYFYRAQIFNWFSAHTDSLLDVVHTIIDGQKDESFPLKAIVEYFRKSGKETNISRESLNDSRLRFIILNLIYVEKNQTSPFNVRYKGNKPEIDHIFPKSRLAGSNYSYNEINHIANYRFCGQTENRRKRAEDAATYFTRLKNEGVNIESHLLTKEYSDAPEKMTIENYRDFFEKRLQNILSLCEQVINR